MTISGVTPYLWYDDSADEAATFYVSLFPNSRITNRSYYNDDAQRPKGSILTVDFELFGRPFSAINGGPEFPHTEAVSFQVNCDTQDEINRIWDALVADGGQESRCGWCKDRWGVNWQVTATALGELLQDPDPLVSGYAFRAMMGMSKIVIADLSPS